MLAATALVLQFSLGGIYAILPGQDKLVDSILGAGESLPGHCRLDHRVLGQTELRGCYDCGSGPVVVIELTHPSVAPAGAIRTQKFGVVASSMVPAGLVDAIAERARRHEGAWRWSGEEAIFQNSAQTLGRKEWVESGDKPVGVRAQRFWQRLRETLGQVRRLGPGLRRVFDVDWGSGPNLRRERWAAIAIASIVPVAFLVLVGSLLRLRRRGK